jgi:hypothetical protein
MKPLSGDTLAQTTVEAVDSHGIVVQLPVEFVGAVPATDELVALIVRLPAELSIGDASISISVRGLRSNNIMVSIRAP